MDAKTLGYMAAYPHTVEYGTVFVNDGEFPCAGRVPVGGLTKREEFAKAAMQGFIGHLSGPALNSGETAPQAHARAAVAYADALLEELAKDQP